MLDFLLNDFRQPSKINSIPKRTCFNTNSPMCNFQKTGYFKEAGMKNHYESLELMIKCITVLGNHIERILVVNIPQSGQKRKK